jgi:raffinose/stachyose/melibiose transport system substrate-binding protein
MHTTNRRRRRHAIAIAALASISTSVGGGIAAAGGEEQVTIEWWHLQNNPPGLTDWQNMADAFMAENPNVTIEITAMENDAIKPAIQAAVQAGDPPDLFQSWGGGVLLDQVEAGAVQDITATVEPVLETLNPGAASLYNIDGVQYGLPYNVSMVGMWYNVDLFEQAGITETPTTWAELLEIVQTLKDADITPITVGAGALWPAHFWYSYLMVRIGGAEVMNQIAEDNNWEVPAVIQAGEHVAELVAMEPFQEGYLGAQWDTPDGEAGVFASGGAAMDLQGQWALGTFRNQGGLGEQPDTPLPFRIGWFPFPTVEGGAGDPADGFGGADGFIVGADAPPETAEFLNFLVNTENQRTFALSGTGIPANVEATAALTEAPAPDGPVLTTILEALNSAPFHQQFLDQFYTADVGAEVNAQSALLFAGETSPEEAAAAITAVAGGG